MMIRYWPEGHTTQAGICPLLESDEEIDGVMYRFIYIPPCMTPDNPDGKKS